MRAFILAAAAALALSACGTPAGTQLQADAQARVAAVEANPKQALDDACYILAHQTAEIDILANAAVISADTAATAKAGILTAELYCNQPPADLRQAALLVEDAVVTVAVTLAKR